MFFNYESSRINTACEKEWKYIAKQEERLKKAVLRKTAGGPSVFGWKEKLEQKIPAKLCENLIKDYEIQNYAIGLKGTRKELKKLRKKTNASEVRDIAVTAAEGIGLGALGIGLPLIGILGGAGNPVYYGKVMRYIQLKYHKRYLLELLKKTKQFA